MRHGQDDEYYIGGWSDVRLIDKGIEDVKNNAVWIKDNLNIKKIICSNVLRCRETTKIVNGKLNVDVEYTDNLREQNKGLLNGVKKCEAYKSYKEFLNNIHIYSKYPNGESLLDLYNRIKVYLEYILRMDDDTLLITHRGVINMIYFITLNKELDMNKKQFNVDTASIHELDKNLKKIRRIK